jgi:hypothetical protein
MAMIAANHRTRTARDSEIRRMAFDEGKTLTQIASGLSITDTRVGQILGVRPAREAILGLLSASPDRAFTVREVSSALRMDINRVQFMVDVLRKNGAVTADISSSDESGDHRAFTNIRFKRSGKRFASVVAPVARGVAWRSLTEAEASVSVDHDADVQTQAVETTRPRDDRAEPTPVVEAPTAVVEAAVVEATASEATVPDNELLPVEDIPHFLLIARLLDKDRKISEAAKLLESAGLEDLALQALQKSDDFTPLEREVMAYVRRCQTHHRDGLAECAPEG